MIKLPSQDAARALLQQDGDPYEATEHRKVLLQLCTAKTLTCTHCGFVATKSQIDTFYEENPPPPPPESDPNPARRPLAEGWGLFRAYPRDLNPWNRDPKNFDLVCEPCFHAGHAFIPGFEPTGRYGLLNVISQAELIQAWRSLMLGTLSGKPRAAQPKEAMRSLIASAETELIREVSGSGGPGLRLTNHDLCYWIGYAAQDIVDLAPKIIPDLRFLPSIEPTAYGVHLAFCHRFQPLFSPEALAPEAPTETEHGRRIEPTLEPSATV